MSALVVTGGGSGIGLQVAQRALTEWPDVRCAVLDLDTAGSAEIVARFGSDRVLPLVCDVTSPPSVDAAVDQVCTWAGRIPYLVNSAGNHHRAASLDLAFEDWRRVLAVHLDGTFLVAQRVGRHMAEHGGGAIVNLGSVAMFSGWQERVAYGAAKAAVGSLTKSLAVEWAALGIRVNAVAPGYTDTPFVSQIVAEGYIDADVARGLHALGRFATPDEIADAILFLLSERSSFVTGHVLLVDGGFVAKKLP